MSVPTVSKELCTGTSCKGYITCLVISPTFHLYPLSIHILPFISLSFSCGFIKYLTFCNSPRMKEFVENSSNYIWAVVSVFSPGYPDTWIHGHMYIWIHGYLDTCIPGYLDTCISGYMDTWIPGYLDTWIARQP